MDNNFGRAECGRTQSTKVNATQWNRSGEGFVSHWSPKPMIATGKEQPSRVRAGVPALASC